MTTALIFFFIEALYVETVSTFEACTEMKLDRTNRMVSRFFIFKNMFDK